MLESGTSGSVGGEGGNLLVYPATAGYRQPEDIPPRFIGEKYAISAQILSRFCSHRSVEANSYARDGTRENESLTRKRDCIDLARWE